jgi:hypothetical protein
MHISQVLHPSHYLHINCFFFYAIELQIVPASGQLAPHATRSTLMSPGSGQGVRRGLLTEERGTQQIGSLRMALILKPINRDEESCKWRVKWKVKCKMSSYLTAQDCLFPEVDEAERQRRPQTNRPA